MAVTITKAELVSIARALGLGGPLVVQLDKHSLLRLVLRVATTTTTTPDDAHGRHVDRNYIAALEARVLELEALPGAPPRERSEPTPTTGEDEPAPAPDAS